MPITIPRILVVRNGCDINRCGKKQKDMGNKERELHFERVTV